MARRVGLKDIASALSVDVSTVSRALNRDPRVKAETAALVRATADRLGYRPNAAARALRGGRTNRVAVLLSPPQRRFASPIFLELLATLDQRVREIGKTLTVIAAQSREEEPGLVRSIVEDNLADAIIVSRTRTGDERVRYLLDEGFPFVTFGQSPWADQHPWVDIDYAAAGGMAIDALNIGGAHRTTVIVAPKGLLFSDNYLKGALARSDDLGLPKPTVCEAEITEEAGEAVGLKLLNGSRGNAIACIQDSLAFGIYRAAARMGVRIGKDVAVFGGQNYPGAEHTAPPLSTFSTADSTVAELLSQALINRMESNGDPSFETHMVQPQVILRSSHFVEG